MRVIFPGLLVLTAIVTAAPALAEEMSAPCPQPVIPAAELAPWTTPTRITAAASDANLPQARLRVGQAAVVALHPAEAVRYPATPGKAGVQGGLVEVTIAQAGTYRVALGAPGWVDVLAEGKPVQSIAHGHGQPCSGIRKIVDFPLRPGRHIVVLSAGAVEPMQMLVVRRP